MRALLNEDRELGQFIPVHYHYNMLLDEARVQGFRAALQYVIKPGMSVLELGGGTGILSFFAAQWAEKVICVEVNPALATMARHLLASNDNGHKVDVIEADALDYLPDEPVDVVICEMLHVALLREKQLAVIRSFKQRYLEKFGLPLPAFVPEACIQAVQPVQHDFVYGGYVAPTPVFQNPYTLNNRTVSLADPCVYQSFGYEEDGGEQIEWQGTIVITQDGQLNALRFITKNILAVCLDTQSTIDWHNAYLILPLAKPLSVQVGDSIDIAFSYPAGAPLEALQPLVQIRLEAPDTSIT